MKPKTVPAVHSSHNATKSPLSLGTYLAVSAGAGAFSLGHADGAIIAYNGPAVSVTRGDAAKWLYFSPLAAPSDPTLGTRAGTTNIHRADYFQITYTGANYLYTQKFEGLIKTFWGTASGGGKQVPLKLDAGATIDASSNFWFNDSWSYMNKPGWTTAESPWATGTNDTTGYVPFKFSFLSAPTDFYYGWAEYTYDNGDLDTLTLNNFAYNADPNIAITASAVPEPSTLLLLALGGAGVAAARRRRKTKPAAEAEA